MFQSLRIIVTTFLFVSALAFAQVSEPTGQRMYLLGELAGMPVQVDLSIQNVQDSFGDGFSDIDGDLFYETSGEFVAITGSVDTRNNVSLQLRAEGELVGSVTAVLADGVLEGNFTPFDSDVTPINWQIVAEYASLYFRQGGIETAAHVPQFTTRASIINEPWQDEAFSSSLDFAREGQRDAAEYDLFAYWLEDTFDIAYYADDFVSVLRVYYVYGGGAHPNVFYEAHNVGIGQDAVELSLSDALTAEGLVFLSDYVLEQLSEEGAEFVTSGSVTQLTEQDMSAFVVSPQGLHIHFAPYAVGPYVQGTFEIIVPWQMLANYMQPDNPLVRFL